MITLSRRATEKIKEIIESEGKTDWGLRIAVKGGGCSGFTYRMEFDRNKTEIDQILDCEGIKIYIDSKSMIYLSGTEIDFTEGLDGSGFVFTNPNVKRSCGCGNSFDV
ncbi:MAG: iron-sulfur cluster insertion protein ErpA [Calditrichaceae bacterium]|nr:iron-sulfur cluster insertion protein ErpA [Calditrichaceae bacterium]MBN2708852.1 iron-sulfur cluster insertion protein ErpA [Calditrichaceae bacterium]RQV97621.1 MAG: iron-sulfur cluster insertion protein ErpA [Calditrichota bacterium]